VNVKSCARSNEGVWLLACLVIYFLCLRLNVFSTTLCTRLGFSHLFVLGCHTSFVTSLWILWGYIFFVAHMVGREWRHLILCEILSQPLWEMRGFMSCANRPMSFCPYLSLHIIELTLCYQSMMFCTLANIVIVDPTQVDLVSWIFFFEGLQWQLQLRSQMVFIMINSQQTCFSL
jgi:hypothetical protein